MLQIPLPFTDEVVPVPAPELPAAFDDSCKHCSGKMNKIICHYNTRRKPFATFQCPSCKLRLFIFEAPITPLLIWSNHTWARSTRFSEYIDEVLEKREHDREVRKLRYNENVAA